MSHARRIFGLAGSVRRDSSADATLAAEHAPSAAARIVFWAVAVLVLFLGLGARALFGPEDRWAEITRNMLLTRDFFHPIINNEVYFDKPLLSYWLIAAASLVTRGLDELATRIPSALAGLVALWATRSVGRRLWSEGVAHAAGWMLLTGYGFLYWARSAAADTQDLAAVILAVAWFFARERSPGFATYFVFYLICAIGAQMKGLPAVVLPILVLLPWLVREGRWRSHLRVSHLVAVLACAAVYLAPFLWSTHSPLPEGYSPQHRGLGGLGMVYRENILRFFEPFDHVEPFYLYFYELPRNLLPWSPLFLGALVAGCASLRRLDRRTRWLVDVIVLVFLFFSASGSKRWYYILPIAPFCALFMAVSLTEPGWVRTKRLGLRLVGGILFAVSLVYVASPLVWPLAAKRGFFASDAIRIETFLLGSVILVAWVLSRMRPEILPRCTGTDGRLAWVIVAATVLSGGLFDVQEPSLEPYRTTKDFAVRVRELALVPGEILFLHKAATEVVFYLGQSSPIPVLDGPELRSAVAGAKEDRLVVSREEFLPELRTVLSEAKLGPPVATEAVMPWEKGQTAEKLVAFRVSVPHERAP